MNPDFFKQMTGHAQEDIKVPTSPLLTYLARKAKQPEGKPPEHGALCVQGHSTWSDAHGIMLAQDVRPRQKWEMLHDYREVTMHTAGIESTVKVGIWDLNGDAALRCACELMQADPEMKSDLAVIKEVQEKWEEWAKNSYWGAVPFSPRLIEVARINLESLLEVTRGFLKAGIPLGPAFEEYKAKIPELKEL